jgi:lysozyme family protein
MAKQKLTQGFDRSQNGGWTGWAIIDSIKAANPGASVSTFDGLFGANAALQPAVQQFYKTGYWDPLQLDTITDQQVVNALFDCSVNPCVISTARAAQMACNTVQHKSVTVDGQFGGLTLSCINTLPPDLYLTALHGIRAANYYERVRLTPADAEWLNSWLGRCKAYVQINS